MNCFEPFAQERALQSNQERLPGSGSLADDTSDSDSSSTSNSEVVEYQRIATFSPSIAYQEPELATMLAGMTQDESPADEGMPMLNLNRYNSLTLMPANSLRMTIVPPLEPEAATVGQLLKSLQVDLKHKKDNVMWFESAVAEGVDGLRPAFKRNNSEKRLARRSSFKITDSSPGPADKDQLLRIERLAETSGDGSRSGNSKNASFTNLPVLQDDIPRQAAGGGVHQRSMVLDDLVIGSQLQTPQLKRRRVTAMAIEIHSGPKEPVKKMALLDLDAFKQEVRHFVPNPNKPKVFEFKSEPVPSPDCDERTLIDFEKSYRRPLVVDSSASPYLGRILNDGTFRGNGEASGSFSTTPSSSMSFVERARRFGSILDLKLKLGNLKKVKPPRDTILLKVD